VGYARGNWAALVVPRERRDAARVEETALQRQHLVHAGEHERASGDDP
jgi:hypothetical protein